MKKFIKLNGDYFNTDSIRIISPSYSLREIFENGKIKTLNEYYPSVIIFYKDDDDGIGQKVVLERQVLPDSYEAIKRADSILEEQMNN